MNPPPTVPLRVFGAELSPYSVKVRSYFRYKRIPHEWINRDMTTMEEFGKYAKLPLIPLVVTPDGTGLQDSTPIIEHFETLHPAPSIHPPDPALAFISALLEEYGDEWGNKPMFHYRWFYEPDQHSAAERLAASMNPGADADTAAKLADAVRTRMVPRLSFVGSSPATKDTLESSFRRQLALLERHLATRPYLFGGRPVFADFGIYPQLYECLTDPTPGAIMRAEAPAVVAWIERMLDPRGAGGLDARDSLDTWDALGETLLPLLRDEVAGLFLPWSDANARALSAGQAEFSVDLEGRPFSQQAQKYHAKSLAALRARFAAVPDHGTLDPILRQAGCLRWLTGGAA
jgi:glutathione S-transferase